MFTICDSSEPSSSPCFPAVEMCKTVKCDGGPAILLPQYTTLQIGYVFILREKQFVCGPSLSKATSSIYNDDTFGLSCHIRPPTTVLINHVAQWPVTSSLIGLWTAHNYRDVTHRRCLFTLWIDNSKKQQVVFVLYLCS